MRIITYNQNPAPKPTLKRRIKKIFKKLPGAYTVVTWLFRLFAAGIVVMSVLFIYYGASLPDPNKLLVRDVPESTKIFAADNTLLYEIHGEVKRTQVNLDQINDDLKHATIAVEDKDFYSHSGISIRGLFRSVLIDVITLQKSQGGSTITQQFVKNALLTKDKSLSRKLKEIILSIELEARFSKDDILKLYLNEIPYGRNAYGIEAASQAYFNKHAKDLTLAESAYLAALPQSTTYYNPYGPHRDALENRKNTILALMKDQGYISEERYNEAKDTKVTFVQQTNGIIAPHFVFYVQDYLANKYGEKTLEQGGLKVYTTLDPKLQAIAETAVKEGSEKNKTKYNAYNAALVAVNPKNGYILAMVGSRDYFGDSEPAGCKPPHCLFDPNVNAATSPLQPGSSFKPYAYVTSFTKDFGYAPASMLMDVVTNFGTYQGKSYTPKNYDFKQHGPVSIRQALAGSLNIPAVKILSLVGVDRVAQTAHDLGITSPLADCGLSLVLGGCEVKLVDHVAAYATLANGGVKNDKTAIIKVVDKDGKTLEEYTQNEQQVIDPEAVYELTSIMTDNNARSYVFGPNSPLTLGADRPVAAKTGTTQNWHDGWTMGFTPSLAAGVWAGNNDGTLMKSGADGVYVAAPIWNRFMKEALKDQPVEQFKQPSGIQKIVVDSVSGKLPTSFSPDTKSEVFASYSTPKDEDNVHVGIKIDSTTGLPATELTLPENVTIKTYTILHSEKPNNPAWENPVIAWATANGYSYPTEGTAGQFLPPQSSGDGPEVSIIEPQDGSTISQTPWNITISAASQKGIARIDLLIDGERIQSLTTAPYTFTINKKYNDGQHTISIHAVDGAGNTSDTTSSFESAEISPITMNPVDTIDITNNGITLTAKSNNNYANILEFYYQASSGAPKSIGLGSQTLNIDGSYSYTINWTNLPKPGKYNIFAKASSFTSNKITLTIPENK